MITTEVVWCGPERFIPDVGMAVQGTSLFMPLHKAKSFVAQGLAKYPSAKSKYKTKEVN